MREQDIREKRRETFLRMKQQHFSKKARRGAFIGFLLTLLITLLLLLMQFGFLLLPKDSLRLRRCTLVSMESVRGRTVDYVSIFEDASGSRYRITASRQDYIGREISLYTGDSTAYRTAYEVPRAYLWLIVCGIGILMLFGLELWYLVKYLEYKKYFAPLIKQGETIKKE